MYAIRSYYAFGELMLLDVLVQYPRHRRTQTGHMGTTIALRNVVGETQDRLLKGVVPLHCHVHRDPVLLARCVEYIGVQHVLRPVHVFDKTLDPAGELETFLLARKLIDSYNFV